MEYMRTLPDGAFDLAIVDPPYGIGVDRMNPLGGRVAPPSVGKSFVNHQKSRLSSGSGKLKGRALQTLDSSWDDSPPPAEYFAELRRVSRNQIIWGGNYFPLPPSRCVICWDKLQPWENFSAWEMAWTSFDSPASKFAYSACHPGNLRKIHPTQKPVALYKWLLSKYAKPGDRILDTHLGSGSIALACHELGFDLVGCEIDADYFNAAKGRLEEFQRQGLLAI